MKTFTQVVEEAKADVLAGGKGKIEQEYIDAAATYIIENCPITDHDLPPFVEECSGYAWRQIKDDEALAALKISMFCPDCTAWDFKLDYPGQRVLVFVAGDGYGEIYSPMEVMQMWHRWFDDNFAEIVGVKFKAEAETDNAPEIDGLEERKKLCTECMSDVCIFNPEGTCLAPLVTGQKPEITEDGCKTCRLKEEI